MIAALAILFNFIKIKSIYEKFVIQRVSKETNKKKSNSKLLQQLN